MKQRAWLIVLLAAALPPMVPLRAQEATPLLSGDEALPMRFVDRETDIHGNPIRGYSSRVNAIVFDNAFEGGSAATGVVLSTPHILEDFDLSNGPFANEAVKRISAIGLVMVMPTCCSLPCSNSTISFDTLIEVFNGSSSDYTSPDMLQVGGVDAVPIFSARVPMTGNCPASGQEILAQTVNLAPNGVGGSGDVSFLLAANQGYIRIRFVSPGTTTLMTTSGPRPLFGTGAVPHNVGLITSNYGRDINLNSDNLPFPYAGGPSGLEGGTPVITGAAAGAHEHRRVSSFAIQSMCMFLRGDFTCPPPPATNLGSLLIGTTGIEFMLSRGEVKWHRFSIPLISAGRPNYFDIHVEGSNVEDLTMALYGDRGDLLHVDREDGSGLLPHLTFGICRRARDGDGHDYDGRDGELAAGIYYLAISGPQENFLQCFAHSNPSFVGGRVQLTLRLSPETQPGPPDPPTLTHDFGTVVLPGAEFSNHTGQPGVAWYKFALPVPTGAVEYMDMYTSELATFTDTEIALYTASGDLVQTDDDDGQDSHAMLTFGAPGSPRAPFGNGASLDGRDGNLTAGDYYIAVALYDFTPSIRRWCSQTNAPQFAPSTLSLSTNIVIAPTSCHGTCVADFDDGSGLGIPDDGVTIDDLLYYLFIFEVGQGCADIDDGSFTGTPDGGVTIDDLLYYLSRFEAGC